MLGFIIGTACLLGFIATARHGRRCGGGGFGWHGGGCGSCGGGSCHGGWGGWHGPRGGGPFGHGGPFAHGGPFGGGGPFGPFGPFAHGGPFGPGGPRAFILRGLFERLETTPGQEKAIVAALEELREAAREHHGELLRSRVEVARAMKSPGFDEALLGELFARHDATIEAMRKAFVGALAKVHEALDERQRGLLAELIESGPFAFGRSFGGPWAGGPSRGCC
jgi:Spy/CpxP family protein refolding chaperone